MHPMYMYPATRTEYRSLGFQMGCAACDVYLKPLATLSTNSPRTALAVAWLMCVIMGLICAYLLDGTYAFALYLHLIVVKSCIKILKRSEPTTALRRRSTCTNISALIRI